MAARSYIKLRGFFESIPGGSKDISVLDHQNDDPPSSETQTTLLSGETSFDIPTNAEGVIIIFDPTSTVTKVFIATGDTGVALRANGWNVMMFDDTPPSAFILKVASDDTGKTTTIIFF